MQDFYRRHVPPRVLSRHVFRLGKAKREMKVEKFKMIVLSTLSPGVLCSP